MKAEQILEFVRGLKSDAEQHPEFGRASSGGRYMRAQADTCDEILAFAASQEEE